MGDVLKFSLGNPGYEGCPEPFLAAGQVEVLPNEAERVRALLRRVVLGV